MVLFFNTTKNKKERHCASTLGPRVCGFPCVTKKGFCQKKINTRGRHATGLCSYHSQVIQEQNVSTREGVLTIPCDTGIWCLLVERGLKVFVESRVFFTRLEAHDLPSDIMPLVISSFQPTDPKVCTGIIYQQLFTYHAPEAQLVARVREHTTARMQQYRKYQQQRTALVRARDNVQGSMERLRHDIATQQRRTVDRVVHHLNLEDHVVYSIGGKTFEDQEDADKLRTTLQHEHQQHTARLQRQLVHKKTRKAELNTSIRALEPTILTHAEETQYADLVALESLLTYVSRYT